MKPKEAWVMDLSDPTKLIIQPGKLEAHVFDERSIIFHRWQNAHRYLIDSICRILGEQFSGTFTIIVSS